MFDIAAGGTKSIYVGVVSRPCWKCCPGGAAVARHSGAARGQRRGVVIALFHFVMLLLCHRSAWVIQLGRAEEEEGPSPTRVLRRADAGHCVWVTENESICRSLSRNLRQRLHRSIDRELERRSSLGSRWLAPPSKDGCVSLSKCCSRFEPLIQRVARGRPGRDIPDI